MASKRDLVEAQTYSRRRLLTAFTSGAPGGRELEPTKPLRGVVAGVSLSVLLVLGSLGLGLLSPTLPDGWDDQSLVIVEGDGSRYVGIQGTLHPVLNVTSARLVLDSGAFHVVDVSEDDITDAPRGATLGIPGAPDELPLADRLTGTGWAACVAADGTTTLDLDPDAPAAAPVPGTGVLVDVAGTLYLVADGVRHRIPPTDEAAVLRALGLDTATPLVAGADWLNLVPLGTDLAALTVAGAGDAALPQGGLPLETRVGELVEVSGTGDGLRRYVVDAQGELAPLSDLAYPLYLLGAGDLAATALQVTASDIAAVRTSGTPVAPADLPATVPTLPAAGQTPCVVLSTGDAERVDLVLADGAVEPGVRVAPGSGALVRAQSSDGATATVRLVDGSGRAYPVPDASDEVLARLGFTPDDVVRVPPAWAALLPTGPSLTVEAAATEVSGGTAAEGAASGDS
ncbi:type VII secretion protein EccB [Cellulomonas triticagri]|uniref:Type VII secretion protein EccB n=1 Tax=Cellulomonas triticagri TaxID=2483352 RepID=A0A3M2IU84_9CELL|nr:type VII secretion protein EccB [Cellulomonas triticagri]RMI02833.1 type VII secretion protein EccB [Cellulomonas triticagri]